MTKTQINLDFEDEHIAVLDKLAGKALKRQAVARMLVIAAIEAVRANGGTISLPPKFAVEDKTLAEVPTFRINEPVKPARYKK